MKARKLLSLLEERKKVLVVDDEEDICTILKHNLSLLKLDCDCSTSLLQGKELLRRNKYDLLITDTISPETGKTGYTGLDLARYAKSLGIPVIVVTGSSSNYSHLGFVTLQKPFSNADLSVLINKILSDL